MLILEVLKYAAQGMPDTGSPAVQAALAAAPEPETQWALRAGLGPMLYRATLPAASRLPAARATTLLSADLTAQVLHGCKVEATKSLLDLCAHFGTSVTLLKGISISEQCYPVGHLRPMGDIDLLIAAQRLSQVEAALLRRGFRQGPPMPDPDAQHGAPLFDPTRQVWIELHSRLFPSTARLCGNRLFSPAQIADQVVATTFEGRAVHRLTAELQLIYIASYWTRDLSMQRIDPGFVMPLLDATCLVTDRRTPIDWDRLVALVDNDLAAASLAILLGHLARQAVVAVPAAVLAHLFSVQRIIGRMELVILDRLLCAYLIGGKPFRLVNSWRLWAGLTGPGSPVGKLMALPWQVLFPPDDPNRFNASAQRRRIARWLRRLQADRPPVSEAPR